MDNLEDIFDETDEAPEAVEPQPEPEQPQEAEAEKPDVARDEKGRFAEKGEKGESPSPVGEKPEPEFDHAAVIGERKRRQEAEAQLQALQQQLQEKKDQEPAPTIWDDDQAWQQHFGGQVVSTAVQQATFKSKLEMSEMMARQANPEFAESWDDLNGFLNENPTLAKEAVESAHPWDHAFRAFKSHKTMKDLGATDVDDLKAKIEAQVREEMAAKAPAPQPNVPQSLAGEQSAKSGGVAPNTAFTLEDILNT